MKVIYYKHIYFLIIYWVCLNACKTMEERKGKYRLSNKGNLAKLKVMSFNILATIDVKSLSEVILYGLIENSMCLKLFKSKTLTY